MSTISAIQKTIDAQNKAKAIKVEPNSADTSLVDGREVGVLVSGSNGTTGIYSGSVTVEAGDSGHGRLGGDVTISSGDGFYAGNVYVFGGSNLTEPPLTTFGGIYLYTGGVDKENLLATSTSTTSTGLISIQTGDVSANSTYSGQVIIKSGSPHTHTGSTSGSITIGSGGTSNTANAGNSGSVTIESGQGGTDSSGQVFIRSGATSSATSGGVSIRSGATNSASSGVVFIASGDTSSATSGLVNIETGSSLSNSSGVLTLQSGVSYTSPSGRTELKSGYTSEEDSGEVIISSGHVGADGFTSGDVTITTGGLASSFVANEANSGGVNVLTGPTLDVRSGEISITTGANFKDVGTGDVSLSTGDLAYSSYTQTVGTNISTGTLDITTGAVRRSVTAFSGGVVSDTTKVTGGINISTGGYATSGIIGSTGNITIGTGSVGSSNEGYTGTITIQPGTFSSTFDGNTFPAGHLYLKGGDVSRFSATKGYGGNVQIIGGTSTHGTTTTSPIKLDGGVSYFFDRNVLEPSALPFPSIPGPVEINGSDINIHEDFFDAALGDNSVFDPTKFQAGGIRLVTGQVVKTLSASPWIEYLSSDYGVVDGTTPSKRGEIYIHSHSTPRIQSSDYRQRFLFVDRNNNITVDENIYVDNVSFSGNLGTLFLTTPDVSTSTAGGDITLTTGNRTGTSGNPGDITIQTGGITNTSHSANGNATGKIDIITGNSVGAGYTGGITIQTGDRTDETYYASNNGGIIIKTGNNYGKGNAGSIEIRGGDAQRYASPSPGAELGGSVRIYAGSSINQTNDFNCISINGGTSYHESAPYYKTDIVIQGSTVRYEDDNVPGFKTIKGGDILLKGGYVAKYNHSSGSIQDTGYVSDDDGTQDQDLGEVKVISGSVPTESSPIVDSGDRLLSISSEGILQALNLRILSVGSLAVTWSVGNSTRVTTLTTNVPSLSGSSYISGIFTVRKISGGNLNHVGSTFILSVAPGSPNGSLTLGTYAEVSTSSVSAKIDYILYVKM